MRPIIPDKLKKADKIRVIAPSRSLAIISEQTRQIANQRFEDLGLKLSFGKHVLESDIFHSSSIKSRLQDLEPIRKIGGIARTEPKMDFI